MDEFDSAPACGPLRPAIEDVPPDHPAIREFRLLVAVAAGECAFTDEEREWGMREGMELSGYRMLPVRVAEGGDQVMAERLLSMALQAEAVGAQRRLSPAMAPPKEAPDVQTSGSAPVAAAPDADAWRQIAAGARVLSDAEREVAIIDVMVLSDGRIAAPEAAQFTDVQLAEALLSLSEPGSSSHPARIQREAA